MDSASVRTVSSSSTHKTSTTGNILPHVPHKNGKSHRKWGASKATRVNYARRTTPMILGLFRGNIDPVYPVFGKLLPRQEIGKLLPRQEKRLALVRSRGHQLSTSAL